MVQKLTILATIAAPLALFSTAASAQQAQAQAPVAPAAQTAVPAAAVQISAGAKVFDAAGEEVGTVKSVTAPNFVIDTGKNAATLAIAALGTGPKGPTLGLTRVQLDAAAEKAAGDAAASLASAIAVDAPVHAADGTTVLGKISEVAETDFLLDTGKARVKLPKTAVAKGENGLFIGMTAEAFAEVTKSAGA